MITFKEWWVMQFLPKEHRYAAEQSWNTCHREMELIANMRVAETIRTQQAEIERLKGQRDRLLAMLKNMKSELSQSNWRGDLQEEITSIIAEIEAENG